MTESDTERREAVLEQAERLGFGVDDAVVADCVDAIERLEAAAERVATEEPTAAHRGHRSDDEYRALLDVYETPRTAGGGPLADCRIAVKDNIAAEGLELTCGSERLSAVANADATVVTRLLEAGGELVGKANMDALALGPSGEFSDFGPVVNPDHPDRVPGGTSSGSGAAVAADLVDVALGTDTGGSVRIPAACCGVVGVKPSYGLVPRTNFVDFAPSLDTIGPLARDVETAARALDAIAGPDRDDPLSDPRDAPSMTLAADPPEDVTVGLPSQFFERSSDVVSEAVSDAVADSPLTVREVSLPPGEVESAYFLIGATEFVWFLDQAGVTRGQGSGHARDVHAAVATLQELDLGPHIARRVLPAATLDAETNGATYAAARREATRFRGRVESALDDVDALVLPTLRTLPPEPGQMKDIERMLWLLGNTAPFNLSGSPAVSLPVAEREGLPVSAQVVTPHHADDVALAVATVLEDAA